MVAAGLIALLKQPRKRTATALAIGGLFCSLILAVTAFAHVLGAWGHGAQTREVVNFDWFSLGSSSLQLGWVLDPLAAVMLVMVTFVGLLIFIYSTGYMAALRRKLHTLLLLPFSLFAGAMLRASWSLPNSLLLLLFICWEIVGLTSYLLIGFWYHKPSAAAAAAKAFLTTRVGDIFFLLGIVLALLVRPASLLFLHNNGLGAIEPAALATLFEASPPPSDSPQRPPSACSSLPAPQARAASSHCMSGCPTPWKARRPYPPLSTQPPWSRQASTSSRASIR